MTTAHVSKSTHTIERFFSVDLQDAQPISFGFAGRLSPGLAMLTERVYQGDRSIKLTLRATNRYDIPFYATFGWPHREKENPDDHGYGAAALISDLPAELVAAVFTACGVEAP